MFLTVPKKRLLSGLFVGSFGILIVLLGNWWFSISISLIVHLALLEFFRMSEFTGIRPATKTTLVACQILLFFTQLSSLGYISIEISNAILPLSGAAICGWLLLQPVTGSIADIAASIFGLFYLGFLPSHWIKLRNLLESDLTNKFNLIPADWSSSITFGMLITFSSCLMIVGFDIGSYLVGKKFGKHSLSPISPSKTIEGVFGGLSFSILIGAFCGYLLRWKFGIFIGIFIGTLVALFSLVGDLTESMMKRNAGLKDSGNFLPGHGGILDRIDSYLFTPAIVFYIVILLSPLITP
tara:strand:+ start:925 stop:1812 length:888 start_codon:yes stop_codon:yes gene_type:complete